MAERNIASILIKSGITVTPLAVDGGQLLLPAPSVEQEIEHLRGARHTELMISSDTLLALEKCIEKSSGLSFTAGISWRHISHVQRLFEDWVLTGGIRFAQKSASQFGGALNLEELNLALWSIIVRIDLSLKGLR